MKGGTLQLAKVPSFQAAHLPSTSIKYGTLLWNLKRLPKQNTYDGREKPPTSILQFRMVGVVVFEERKVCMVWEGRQATQEGEKEGRRGGGMRIAMCKAMVMQQRMCTGKTREGWRWVPEEVLGEWWSAWDRRYDDWVGSSLWPAAATQVLLCCARHDRQGVKRRILVGSVHILHSDTTHQWSCK